MKNINKMLLLTLLITAPQTFTSEKDTLALSDQQNQVNTDFLDTAENNEVESMVRLLGQKANVNAQTYQGITALHYLTHYGNLNAVLALLTNNADVNISDADGMNPLHLAARNGNSDLVALLVKHNANLNAQTDSGKSPLEIAQENNHTPVATQISRLLQQEDFDMDEYVENKNRFVLASIQKLTSMTLTRALLFGALGAAAKAAFKNK